MAEFVCNDSATNGIIVSMRAIGITLLWGLSLLAGCRRNDLEPEKVATILYPDYAMCAFCGGWFIQVDSSHYRADVPTAFASRGQPVYIRYRLRTGAAGQVGHWIDIESIHAR